MLADNIVYKSIDDVLLKKVQSYVATSRMMGGVQWYGQHLVTQDALRKVFDNAVVQLFTAKEVKGIAKELDAAPASELYTFLKNTLQENCRCLPVPMRAISFHGLTQADRT